MTHADPYWSTVVAERVVRERGLSALPIDPITLAREPWHHGISEASQRRRSFWHASALR